MATYRFANPGTASLKLGDRPVYGSSRLGTYGQELELHSLQNWDPADPVLMDEVALHYELTDHLGNVCAVVTGRLMDGNGGGTPKQAELVSAQGYEPFGSLLPGRNFSADSYRFGFNGQEKDDEVHNATGTSVNFDARIYDPRVARWLSLDPKATKYPSESNYAYTSDNPVLFVDEDGKDRTYYLKVIDKQGNGHLIATRVVRNNEVAAKVSDGYDSQHMYFNVYNVSTSITIDLRKEQGQQLSVTDDGADYSNPSEDNSQSALGAFASLFSEVPDMMGEGSSQSDGWRFTSEFDGEGSGVKSDHDPQTTNVDLLMAAIGAMGKSTELPSLHEELGLADFANNIKEQFGAYKDVMEEMKKWGESKESEPTQETCGYCGGDTIPIQDTVNHSGPFKAVP